MTSCALKITHIGEALFASALNKDKALMRKIIEGEYEAVPEAGFTDEKGKTPFDGKHRIDVLLVPKDKESEKPAIPIELKLGQTRMRANQSEFGRFLTGYGYDKRKKKFTGSMISILSGKKGSKTKIKYPLKYEGVEISADWVLVVLTENIGKEIDGDKTLPWAKKPAKILSFEELFCGKKEFLEETVRDLIEPDKGGGYYETWLSAPSRTVEKGEPSC